MSTTQVVTKNNLGGSFYINPETQKLEVASVGAMTTSYRYKENFGILNGFIGSAIPVSSSAADDFAATSSLATWQATPLTRARIHFKLPFTKTSFGMFRLHFKGYLHGAAEVLDTIVSGYIYTDGLVYNPARAGTHVDNFTIYVGSDNHCYIRFDTTQSMYYGTIRVDSMGVGNGQAINRGELTAIFDERETL